MAETAASRLEVATRGLLGSIGHLDGTNPLWSTE